MQKTVIAVTVAGLAFVVVSLWVLRTEPAGPLLFLPNPGSESNTPSPDSGVARPAEHPPFDFPPAQQLQNTDEETPSTPVASDQRREQVRSLIRQLRPDHPDSAIDVWVEEFAELPDHEIRFLLNQLGGQIGSASSNVLTDGLRMASAAGMEIFEQPADTATPGSVTGMPATNTASQNLQNCTTVGYRESVHLQVRSAGSRTEPHGVTVRNFACGEAQETGDPLHLALRTPGPVFFLLEDGRLTRNGMFTLMPDGRLGLPADQGWVALHQSPTLSADSTLKIDAAGRALFGPDQTPVGHIAVVRVEDAAQLTTEDGVYFRAAGDVFPDVEFQLQSGALEMSNVNVDRNRSVMQALQRHGTTD